jgi:hypothetical protein
MAWRCGKCDEMDIPEHRHFRPKRDPDLRVKRVVAVVWSPSGIRAEKWLPAASQ